MVEEASQFVLSVFVLFRKFTLSLKIRVSTQNVERNVNLSVCVLFRIQVTANLRDGGTYVCGMTVRVCANLRESLL